MDFYFFEKLALILASFNWGAICFVSVVHYPLFADVPGEAFVPYHRKHVSKTTLLLGTTLTLEMIINIFLIFLGPQDVFHSLPLVFLAFGWAITFLISVPQHTKLEKGFCPNAHRVLMLSNWARVFCWGTALLFFSLRLF